MMPVMAPAQGSTEIHIISEKKPCDGLLRPHWALLADRQNNPTVIYQTPEFFEYLSQFEQAENLELLIMKGGPESAIAGFVPLQKFILDIPFSAGKRSFLKASLPGLRVLGSEPMIPATSDAHDTLFETIASLHRDRSVIEMDQVSVDSFLWQNLLSSKRIRRNFLVYVLYGVRECHFVHLPSSIMELDQRLSRKRRYNLRRQERLLEQHLNQSLELKLVNAEENVPALISAMNELRVAGSDDPVTARKYMEAARHGFLFCFLLSAGGHTIGIVQGTKSKETYRIHAFHYDRTLSKFSVGTTLWHKTLRFLIDYPAFKNVDMGYGNPVYRNASINTIHKRGKILLLRRTWLNYCLIQIHRIFCTLVDISAACAGVAKAILRFARNSIKDVGNTRNADWP